MKLKYSKWIAFILICMSLTASYFIYKAVKHYQFKKEEAEHYAYRKKCGNPPNVDIVANKDAYMDKTRLYLFQQILNNVVPPIRKGKDERFTHRFVVTFRAMYLSPLSAKDYKEFITLIESMDIHKTLQENFKLEAGVVNDAGNIRYFIGDKDVIREEFIEFFKKNLSKFSILHDDYPINPIKFMPLQDGFITFEEKANAEVDPYPPFKYLTHYLKFPFYRNCCDINSLLEQKKYMKERNPKEDLYTLKDVPNIAEALKKDPNLGLKTSDIELIGRIGQFETIDFVQFGKDTKILSSGINGREETDTVDTCHIVDLK